MAISRLCKFTKYVAYERIFFLWIHLNIFYTIRRIITVRILFLQVPFLSWNHHAFGWLVYIWLECIFLWRGLEYHISHNHPHGLTRTVCCYNTKAVNNKYPTAASCISSDVIKLINSGIYCTIMGETILVVSQQLCLRQETPKATDLWELPLTLCGRPHIDLFPTFLIDIIDTHMFFRPTNPATLSHISIYLSTMSSSTSL